MSSGQPGQCVSTNGRYPAELPLCKKSVPKHGKIRGKRMEYKKEEYVTCEHLMKMKFKIGKIVKCTEVIRSNRLLCFQVEIGNKRCQILSGLKGYYKPEEVIGKKVMVLENVKTTRMAGMKSEGMLMVADGRNGKLALMVPDRDMETGVEIL
jgi:methionyl-tRNA synthetase